MKNLSRSYRRHHVARLKSVRGKYYEWDVTTPRTLGMLVHTSKLCSCAMCCNERKTDGITMAERRDLDRMKDGIEEVNERYE